MVDHVNYLVWRVIICSSNHLWGRGNCKSVAWQVQMGPCYPIPQQMVHVEDIGARKAAYMEILNQLSENLRSALKSMGINKFYSHQALAQDQLRALLDMTKGIDASLNIGIYDGDTSQKERTWLRDNARLLITNPDMLHISVSLSSEGGQAIFTQSFLYRSGQKRGQATCRIVG
ncbi:hypothetical protein RGQ29_005703 [Quercus rubra]|uniref:Uncharacterized protein n=1 Tax=Quercus rubra TaxID=3512 RepID=A0AAN7IAX0_QUERU|nr:hypothetical protein RGQ29_005703 [Quercus rubra]